MQLNSRNWLFERINQRAIENPAALAVAHPQLRLNFEQLAASASGFAAQLEQRGVDRNSTVTLWSKAMTTNLNMAIALSFLGADFVPQNEMIGATSTDHHFHTGDFDRSIPDASIEIDHTWASGTLNAKSVDEKGQLGDFGWYVFSMTKELPPTLKWASTLPPNSREFIVRGLACLANGGTIVASQDPLFLQSEGVNAVTGPAHTLLDLFTVGNGITVALKLADITGDVVVADEIAALLKIVPTVRQVYAVPSIGPAFINLFHSVAAGTRSHGIALIDEIKLVDNNLVLVNTGKTGAIRIKPDSKSDIWIDTNDLGSWSTDGALLVNATSDHVANIGGHAMDLNAIDSEIAGIVGIRDVVVFKYPKPSAIEELYAFVVFEEGFNQSQLKAIVRSRYIEKFGDKCALRAIQGIIAVPRLHDKRPDRKACAALILEQAKKNSVA